MNSRARQFTALILATALLLISFGPLGPAKIAEAATYQLSGRVTDQWSNPIVNASVTVFDSATSTTVASTAADVHGNYALSMNGGTYDIAVAPPPNIGFQGTTTANQSIAGDTNLNFTLTSASTSLLPFSDDFSSDTPGFLPTGWFLPQGAADSPRIQQVSGANVFYFPHDCSGANCWALVSGLDLAPPYTVTTRLNFQQSVADRAGLIIASDSQATDYTHITIEPNIYGGDIEFRPYYGGPIVPNEPAISVGPAFTGHSLSISANTNYWLRVVATTDNRGFGQIKVFWSTDGVTFLPVEAATGLPNLAGFLGLSTAGPGQPDVYFGDFHVTGGAPGPATTLGLDTQNAVAGQTITATGANVAPGEPVLIYEDNVSNPPLASTLATSTGSFSAAFSVPSSADGPHTIIAVGQNSLSLATAALAISQPTAPVRKVVVFLQGIDSSIDSNGQEGSTSHGCPTGASGAFSCIKLALQSNGYNSSDFLEFSYKSTSGIDSGHVDSSTGLWVPNAYQCNDPSNFSLKDSAILLRNMLTNYANNHPEATIHYVLVGHSLGGDVAFQYLSDLVTALPIIGSPSPLSINYNIDSILTIDSQIAGYPLQSLGFNLLPHCPHPPDDYDHQFLPDPATGAGITALNLRFLANTITTVTNSIVVGNAQRYGIRVFTVGDWYDTLQPIYASYFGTSPGGQTVFGADDTTLFNLLPPCDEFADPGCGHTRLLTEPDAVTQIANDIGASPNPLAANPINIVPPIGVSGLGNSSSDPFEVPIDSPSATFKIKVCTLPSGCITDPPGGTIVTLYVAGTTYSATTDTTGVATFSIAPPLGSGTTAIHATYVDPISSVVVTSNTKFYQFTLDTTPPTTIASASLGNGSKSYSFGTWTTEAVQVSLTAADNLFGTGLAHTYYALDSAACTPTALGSCTIYSGSPFTVSAEGNHTLTYFSMDNAGNAEAANTAAIEIDLTPPNPPTGSVNPAPNAAGWNHAPATVSFASNGDAGTTQSGVASCTVPTTISTETANTVVTGTCTDAAGNTSAPTLVTVKLDSMAPHTTTTLVPTANAAGWNKGLVKVTLNSTDSAGGSGVLQLAYGASGAQNVVNTTVAGGTASLNITNEGQTTITYAATDVARNVEATGLAPVKIDKTAPACALTGTGVNGTGQKYIQVTVGDKGSGLASVVATTLTNATMPINFTAGTTSPLVLTATKINQAQAAMVGLQVTDLAGNVTNCDPVMTDLIRDSSQPSTITATGIAQSEHLIHIYNGNPGLTHLVIKVNGVRTLERDLDPNEHRSVDITAALQPGSTNTVVVIARGKQRGQATIVIADS